MICVLALGNWASRRGETAESRLAARKPENETERDDGVEVFSDSMLPLLLDSLTTKCTEVRTLEASDGFSGGLGSLPDRGVGVPSILTRRLGLIVGCCMGFVVFVILVSVLGYLKVKKQRNAVKRDQPIPPEYLSYRHFSIQSGDAGAHGGHPQFITNMGSTSLNS